MNNREFVTRFKKDIWRYVSRHVVDGYPYNYATCDNDKTIYSYVDEWIDELFIYTKSWTDDYKLYQHPGIIMNVLNGVLARHKTRLEDKAIRIVQSWIDEIVGRVNCDAH